MIHIFEDVFLNTILVTGLVIVMMMFIECLNTLSDGRFVKCFNGRGFWQIVVSAFFGVIPGCMGGFAVVSLYTHGLLSFGALIAMMIASSGDESFVMLAMMPDKAWWIFLALFILAIIVGVIVDAIHKPAPVVASCRENFSIHAEEHERKSRHLSWKRVALFIGVTLFLSALAFGMLEHEGHGLESETEYTIGGINLLSEDWMNVMFALFGIGVLVVIVLASDHFINEHLWHHIICEHLPQILAWTFGTLTLLSVLLHFFDLAAWVNDNIALMIVLAALIGIIPESGPHLLFVTLYASGIVPLPVLLASCISQDGHAGLPLLAESRKTFIAAKLVNCLVALFVGFLLFYVRV